MHTAPGSENREPDTIEQPAPTVWPMVAALGVTMMFGGLITHAIVSAVGLLLSLIAAVGWWKEVLPQARVEVVHLPPPGERAGPVVPVPATVVMVPGFGGFSAARSGRETKHAANARAATVGSVRCPFMSLFLSLLRSLEE